MNANFILNAETIDVGHTQKVVVSLNQQVVLYYRPGTSDPASALEDAEKRIVTALQSLFSVHFPRQWTNLPEC